MTYSKDTQQIRPVLLSNIDIEIEAGVFELRLVLQLDELLGLFCFPWGTYTWLYIIFAECVETGRPLFDCKLRRFAMVMDPPLQVMGSKSVSCFLDARNGSYSRSVCQNNCHKGAENVEGWEGARLEKEGEARLTEWSFLSYDIT